MLVKLKLENSTFFNGRYVWVQNRSNMPMFCLKKIISQPWVVQKSQFLEEMTLTHYILMSLIKKSNNKLIKLIK